MTCATFRRTTALFTLSILTGCVSPNYLITGQVEMVATDRFGDISSAECQEEGEEILITEGDTFSIRLSSVFVRNSKELAWEGSEFLVYAEIYDLQPDDRQKLMKVLFKEDNQAPGYLLNQADRLLFGPIAYTGNPIRIRIYVVELDREENEIRAELIKQALRVASSFQPALKPVQGMTANVGDLFATLNPDDVELSYDFTLFPHGNSHGPFLKTGPIALIKTENARRYKPRMFAAKTPSNVLSADYSSEELEDEFGHEVESAPEDYAALFAYDEPDHPLRTMQIADGSQIVSWCVLRAMCGELWLQSVALEHSKDGKGGFVLVDHDRFSDKPVDPNTCGPDATYPCVRTFKIGSVEFKELLVSDGKEVTAVQLGARTQYTEKSHAVITISRGGIPSERSLFSELSGLDQEVITQTLQPRMTPESIRQTLEQLADQLVQTAERYRLIKKANKSLSADQRKSGTFVTYFLKQIVPGAGLPNSGAASEANTPDALRNASILEIVNSMVYGLPTRETGQSASDYLTVLRSYKKENFEANKTHDNKADGTFTFQASPSVAGGSDVE